MKANNDGTGSRERLLEAALQSLITNGILSSTSTSEIADAANVNRAQVYQFFKNRRNLLRLALQKRSWWPGESSVNWDKIFANTFKERRSLVFKMAREYEEFIRIATILVLDRDPEARIFPLAEKQIKHAAQAVEDGEIREGLDPTAVHILTVSTYMGYVTFRDQMAKEFGIDVDDMDTKVDEVFDEMLKGLAAE